MLLAAVDFHKPQFTWWQKTGPWICPHSCGLFFGRWLLWSWKKRIEVRKEKTAITDWLAVDKIQLKVFQTLRWQLRNSIQFFFFWATSIQIFYRELTLSINAWFPVVHLRDFLILRMRRSRDLARLEKAGKQLGGHISWNGNVGKSDRNIGSWTAEK